MFFESRNRIFKGFGVDAHEIAERDSAVARGIVLAEEAGRGSNEAILGPMYGCDHGHPCLHRVGYHAVLDAL